MQTVDIIIEPPAITEPAVLKKPYKTALYTPTFQMPSVFMDQIDPSTLATKDKVIPLEMFHEYLFALKVIGMESDKFKRVMFNVLFYASWFPEETRREFDLAQALYKSAKISAPASLMAMEQLAAPDVGRFMRWIKEKAEDLGKAKTLNNYDAQTVAQELAVAKAWIDHLPEPEQKDLQVLFKPVYDKINSSEFDWNIGFMLRTEIESSVEKLAGIKKEEIGAVVDEMTLLPPSEGAITRLKDVLFNSYFHKKPIDPQIAEKIHDYLNRNAEALHSSNDYWYAWRYLLTLSPKYIPEFVSKHEYWHSLLVTDDENWDIYDHRDLASFVSLYSIYEDLLEDNVVPSDVEKEALLIVLKDESKHSSLLYTDYAKISSAEELKKKLATEYLRRKAHLTEDDRYSLTAHSMGESFFVTFAMKWGAEKTIAFIKKNLPKRVVSRLDTSFDIIRLALDKSPDVAKKMLGLLKNIGSEGRLEEPDDPLWKEMCDIFRGPDPYFDMQTEFVDAASYNNHILGMPDYLIKSGFGAMVKDFYYDQHPFKAVYDLPEDLRPLGNGHGYVTIDTFPNLNTTAHPDEHDIKIVLPSETEWERPEKEKYHGFLTSAIAAGDSLGIAPKAGLYAIPWKEGSIDFIPKKLLESLKEVRRLKTIDPSIGVVGLSLGLEVPKEFKDTAKGSAIYKELEQVCNELHDMGVAIVVSSGNDGNDNGHANLIGFLPHIKLVGAYYTHYTQDRKDDTKSGYSTDGMVNIYAPADPVLSYYGTERFEWMVKGGTSSAQPYVSATILLMHDVNPSLSLDECWQIIDDTADPLLGESDAKAIDPMEAILIAAKRPGSKYESERLKRLEKALIEK